MKLLRLSLLAISVLCYPSTSVADRSTLQNDALKQWDSSQSRHLSPAYPQGGLRKRLSGSSILRNEATFDFVDHTAHLAARPHEPVFVAKLNVRSQYPILSLEDLEEGLDDVSCSESEIKLSFTSSEYMESVYRELMNITEFIAVSSHLKCNDEDQRAPHM